MIFWNIYHELFTLPHQNSWVIALSYSNFAKFQNDNALTLSYYIVIFIFWKSSEWQCANSELLHCHSGNRRWVQNDNALTHFICWLGSFWTTMFGPEVPPQYPHPTTQTNLGYQFPSKFYITRTLNANISKLQKVSYRIVILRSSM